MHHEYAHNAVCCMSWKVKFPFDRGGGGKGRWGTRSPLSEFSGFAPAEAISGTHVRSDRERESCCRVSYLELTFAFLPEIAFGTCHSVTVNPWLPQHSGHLGLSCRVSGSWALPWVEKPFALVERFCLCLSRTYFPLYSFTTLPKIGWVAALALVVTKSVMSLHVASLASYRDR